MTLVGIPAAILLGLLYALSIYSARIVCAVALGLLAVKSFGWPYRQKGLWVFLGGMLVIEVLLTIPVLNIFPA